MKTSFSLFACFVASIASAQTATLLAPSANDQVPAKLVAPSKARDMAMQKLDHTPVSVAHAINDATLDATPKPYLAQSREFWREVAESELHAGVKFTTTAAGALVRLSPVGGKVAALDPNSIQLRAGGRTLSATAASATVADAHALRAAGMAVPEGTLAFRLAAASGKGEMVIAAPQAQGRYLLHVFEPTSTLIVGLNADRDTVLANAPITFRATLADGVHALRLVSGIVMAPDGYSANLAFTRNADGSFSATFTPDAAHSTGLQLWEAHAITTSDDHGLPVQRDAKTAFAVSEATAHFAGTAQVSKDAGALHVALDIAASNASRYQVSGVLYGTGSDGALHAIALAQSAAWVGGSTGSIDLAYAATSLKDMHAPFELRDLRLVDQASMGLIERRSHGLAFSN
ncbi:MAG: DUF4785 family protein [Burkholderiales bacterium]|nr:DUF4785 family protein [Burkholderiales bacterium]